MAKAKKIVSQEWLAQRYSLAELYLSFQHIAKTYLELSDTTIELSIGEPGAESILTLEQRIECLEYCLAQTAKLVVAMSIKAQAEYPSFDVAYFSGNLSVRTNLCMASYYNEKLAELQRHYQANFTKLQSSNEKKQKRKIFKMVTRFAQFLSDQRDQGLITNLSSNEKALISRMKKWNNALQSTVGDFYELVNLTAKLQPTTQHGWELQVPLMVSSARNAVMTLKQLDGITDQTPLLSFAQRKLSRTDKLIKILADLADRLRRYLKFAQSRKQDSASPAAARNGRVASTTSDTTDLALGKPNSVPPTANTVTSTEQDREAASAEALVRCFSGTVFAHPSHVEMMGVLRAASSAGTSCATEDASTDFAAAGFAPAPVGGS